MPDVIDETGKRYGRLTVINRSDSDQHSRATWNCRCDCGNSVIIQGFRLRRANGTRSCGCINQELMRKLISERVKNNSGPRECIYCHRIKQPSEFSRNSGLQCKLCRKIAAKISKKLCPESPATRRNRDLKKKYGITLDEYYQLSQKQSNKCAICNEGKQKVLSVDHCHGTGLVRGLLCDGCNMGIGLLRHDTQILSNALKYLTK